MEQTDHDLLLKLASDMCWLKKVMSNHLKHHWILTVAAFGAFASGAIAVLIKVLL